MIGALLFELAIVLLTIIYYAGIAGVFYLSFKLSEKYKSKKVKIYFEVQGVFFIIIFILMLPLIGSVYNFIRNFYLKIM